MIHDPDLIDRLDALPKETFDGDVFRGTRQSLDPLVSSYSGDRWMRRDGAGVLYTSLARKGEYHLPGVVDLDTLIGQRRGHDVAAQVLEGLAVIGSAPPPAGTNPARGRA